MRRTVPLFIAGAALLSSPATAFATWAPTQTLLASETRLELEDPQAVAAPDGSAAFAFGSNRISVAVKQPGGTFGAPVTLGEMERGAYGETWKLVVGRTGRMLLVWQTQHDVHVAVRDAGAAAFVDLGPVFHALPDVSYAAPIAALAAAVGDDDRLFVGYTDATGATFGTAAPGANTFTTIGHVAAYRSAPDEFGQSPTAIAIAALPDGGAAMLTSLVEPRTIRTPLVRWSPTAGTLPAVDVERTPIPDTGQSQPSVSTAVEIAAVGGPRPTFFWQRATSTPASGGATTDDDVLRLDLAADGTPGTPALVSRIRSNRVYGRESFNVATDPTGVGVVGWIPHKSEGGPGSMLHVSQRGPIGTFGPESLVPGVPAFDDGDGPDPATLAHTGGTTARAFFFTPGAGPKLRTALLDAAAVAGPASAVPGAGDAGTRGMTAAGNGSGDTFVAYAVDQGTAPGTQANRIQVDLDDVTPPALSAGAATVSRAGGIATVALEAAAADTWTPTTVTWTWPDGTTATGPKVSHAFPADAPVDLTVTARDAAGNATTRRITGATPEALLTQAGKTVPVDAGSAKPAPSPVAAPGGATGPRLQRLALTRKRFTVTTGKPKGGRGTIVRFSLSAATPLRFTVRSLVRGYADEARCRTRKPAGRAPKRCTVERPVGSYVVQGRSGANAVPFGGVVARKRLPAGTYALEVRPTGAGTAGAVAAKIRFVIRRG